MKHGNTLSPESGNTLFVGNLPRVTWLICTSDILCSTQPYHLAGVSCQQLGLLRVHQPLNPARSCQTKTDIVVRGDLYDESAILTPGLPQIHPRHSTRWCFRLVLRRLIDATRQLQVWHGHASDLTNYPAFYNQYLFHTWGVDMTFSRSIEQSDISPYLGTWVRSPTSLVYLGFTHQLSAKLIAIWRMPLRCRSEPVFLEVGVLIEPSTSTRGSMTTSALFSISDPTPPPY